MQQMTELSAKNTLTRLTAILLAALLCAATAVAGELRPSRIFADHMVLQRDSGVRVFGTGAPGQKVAARIGKRRIEAIIRDNGEWLVVLPPFPAGGPHELEITSGNEKIVYKDVLFGDVWLFCGQDNMQLSVKNARNAEQEISAANFPQIRFFNVANLPDVARTGANAELQGEWRVCSPTTIPYFSAVAYFFGRGLHKELKVPLGLVETSWAGTKAESWLPREEIESGRFPNVARELADIIRREGSGTGRDNQKQWEQWQEYSAKHGTSEAKRELAEPNFDDSGWLVAQVPCQFDDLPEIAPEFDGAVWFRRKIDIPAELAGKDMTIHLGPIDDFDVTYFNGSKVGQTGLEIPNFWFEERIYKIPGKLVKAGENVIAVRVFDNYASGGFFGAPEQLFLKSGDKTIPLAGQWRFRAQMPMPQEFRRPQHTDIDTRHPEAPSGMFAARIKPLVPVMLKGVVWYQGESNTRQAKLYRELFPALIESWRKAWGEELPFVFVQLPNYGSPQDTPGDDKWAELREAQAAALKLNDTAMVVTIDLGDPKSLRPDNKQDLADRLVRSALWLVYNRETQAQGPVYKGMKIEEGKIILQFESLAGGLVARDGKLGSFAIAGPDKVFHWAEAIVKGNTIEVSSPRVANPTAVRYAWQANPEDANLYNKAGLPAAPFRTDDWPLSPKPE